MHISTKVHHAVCGAALLCLVWGCGGDGSDGASDGNGSTNGATSTNNATTSGNTTGTNTSAGTNSGSTGATSTNNGATASCVPNQAVYEATTKALIETHCGKCHGERPDFGAPYTLTAGYDDLLAGAEGQRKVDRLVARMADKTMPPPGTLVPHAELDTLVGWGSCGEVHPDESIGLVASRPVWEAPVDPPEGARPVDLRAPEFPVGADVLDLYQCFTFELELDEAQLIRRMEVLVDESRVLHHIVVLRDVEGNAPDGPHVCYGMPAGSDYLYAWAPGGGPIEFPEGGLRADPGDRFIVQIHYNNGAGLEGVRDTSGVRFYLDDLGGPEYGMFAPGPISFGVPAGQRRDVEGLCLVREPMQILAGMPHMHEIGEAFSQRLIRADGTEEELIELTGWSFELQYFYSFPMTLEAGDTLETRCTFNNPNDFAVRSGEGTADEMCFNFMYATPPPSERYCDGFEPGDLFTYAPGSCFEDAATDVVVDESSASIEAAPELAGGTWTDGTWMLTDYVLHVPDELPIGDVDLDASRSLAAGQLRTEGDSFAVDFDVRLIIALAAGVEITQDNNTSFAGTFSQGDSPGAGVVEPTCGGGSPIRFTYEVDGDTARIMFVTVQAGASFASVVTFTRR